MHNDLVNLLGLSDEPTVITAEESEEYSTWISVGGSYSPAVNLKVVSKLPSGVYKVVIENNDYAIKPYPINTDELYTFKEGHINTILSEVDDFWSKAELYKENKLSHKRGMLLFGNPGNGKSAVISLLIQRLKEKDGIVFLVNDYKDFNLLTGVLSTVIRKIEPERPIITIIEDIDKLITANGGDDSALLDFLDGKTSIEHHLVIMTSNDTTDLSTALLRPSRIDMRFYLDSPSKKTRQEYFEKKGVIKETAKEYAELTHGFSFADLKEMYISTVILGKTPDEAIKLITSPHEAKNYLEKKHKKIGL